MFDRERQTDKEIQAQTDIDRDGDRERLGESQSRNCDVGRKSNSTIWRPKRVSELLM